MSALLSLDEREQLQRTTGRPAPNRMLRELVDALDLLTAKRPLVLILEDLHWSDAPTLTWLSSAALRRDPAQLLILGTYRLVEPLGREHPLPQVTRELHRQPHVAEL
jgi:predicted ATPase